MCDRVYHVGYGQNSAGERWAWHAAESFIKKALRENGMDEEITKSILDWWLHYPHRALLVVIDGKPWGYRKYAELS